VSCCCLFVCFVGVFPSCLLCCVDAAFAAPAAVCNSVPAAVLLVFALLFLVFRFTLLVLCCFFVCLVCLLQLLCLHVFVQLPLLFSAFVIASSAPGRAALCFFVFCFVFLFCDVLSLLSAASSSFSCCFHGNLLLIIFSLFTTFVSQCALSWFYFSLFVCCVFLSCVLIRRCFVCVFC